MIRHVAYLEIKDLHTHFTQRTGTLFSPKKHVVRAVDGVSLSLEKGEINLFPDDDATHPIHLG
jgi:ABC-type oligopeptide transport system ATPase subunit